MNPTIQPPMLSLSERPVLGNLAYQRFRVTNSKDCRTPSIRTAMLSGRWWRVKSQDSCAAQTNPFSNPALRFSRIRESTGEANLHHPQARRVWRRLNVTAFLMSGVVGAYRDLIGESYQDAAGDLYSGVLIQPVIVLSADQLDLVDNSSPRA
jgi:Protein of unknown function (DUF2000)